MTAAALLAELNRRGVELVAVGDRLRFRPASALTPADKDALRRYKADLLRLLATQPVAWSVWPEELGGHRRGVGAFAPCAMCGTHTWATYNQAPLCLPCARHGDVETRLQYRATFYRLWAAGANNAKPDGNDLQIVAKLADDVGEPVATVLRRRWALDWWAETRRCPWCGEPAEHHDWWVENGRCPSCGEHHEPGGGT